MLPSIPSTLAPFFQEYDLNKLRIEQDAGTIIERTLRFGSRAELHWLFSTYPRQQIVDWIEKWGRFGLTEPHYSFWKLVFDIPGAE